MPTWAHRRGQLRDLNQTEPAHAGGPCHSLSSAPKYCVKKSRGGRLASTKMPRPSAEYRGQPQLQPLVPASCWGPAGRKWCCLKREAWAELLAPDRGESLERLPAKRTSAAACLQQGSPTPGASSLCFSSSVARMRGPGPRAGCRRVSPRLGGLAGSHHCVLRAHCVSGVCWPLSL